MSARPPGPGPPHLTALACAAALSAAAGATELPSPAGQTVVVTATRHAMLAIDAPAALSVVTRRDIEARGADNVLEAVRGEPGLSLQGRAVGGRQVLGMRGLDSRHTLFLVDGRRVSASDGVVGASDFQVDWVASDDIERIEVLRGPMSVLYGSEALGGVVNVITRQPGSRWRVGALAEGRVADSGGRGGDGHRLALQADGPLPANLALRAGFADSRSGAVASAADARIAELEARHKREAWLGLAWRPPGGQRIEAEARLGREERDADARERSGRKRYHLTENDIARRSLSLGWEAEWAALAGAAPLATQLRAYRNTLDVENRRSNGVAVNAPQTLDDPVLEGQARQALGDHALTAGFEARNEALSDPGLPGGRAIARQRALFLQDEWALRPALTLTAGLRHDDHARFGSALSPRAYAVWRAAPGWTVKGGYSRGYKAPNLKQIVPGARAEGPNTFLGNASLQPESSHSVEAGIGWQQGAAQAQLMVFDQRVTDLIEVKLVTPGTVPGTGIYTYENLSRARLRGAELAGALPLGHGWQLGGQYTWLDARNGAGAPLERRPRHSASARLDWTRGAWRAGLLVEHAGRQWLPSTTVGQPAQRAPDTTRVDAQVSRALPGGLTLQLGVRNATGLSLAEKSPLFTQAEAPRTWRLALRGAW